MDNQEHSGGAHETNYTCQILLVSAQWRSRAFLLAELQEAGYDATALPWLSSAVRALMTGRVRPKLILLDVTSDPEASLDRVQQVLRIARGASVALLVGAYDVERFASLREEVAAWLSRPIRVGRILATVRELVD